MASIAPEQARDLVVSVLRRALHGPSGIEDAVWPGNNRQPIVVHKDQIFSDWNSLNEALINEQGQEVLGRSPTQTYGVGALYPVMSQEEEEALTVEQNISQRGEDDPDVPPVVLPQVEEFLGDAEEMVQVSDGVKRPRSIALTFHLPPNSSEIRIAVSGGRYKRLPVVIAGSAIDLWQRIPIAAEAVLSPSKSTFRDLDTDELTLRVGVDSRRSNDGYLVTVFLVNLSKSVGDVPGHCLFQAQISAEVSNVLPYPSALAGGLSDDAAFDLLYRKHQINAIGHGTDAVVRKTEQGYIFQTETMPSVQLRTITPDVADSVGNGYGIGMQDLSKLNAEARRGINRLIAGYRLWIESREGEVTKIGDARLIDAATRHLSGCRDFLRDIEAGWSLVQSNAEVARCLSWTSQVMNDQRVASTSGLRESTLRKYSGGRSVTIDGSYPHALIDKKQGVWRPFQIAFILASLPSTIDPLSSANSRVDIIWMPTGGGKTEAYLGLSAFTMLWRRRRRVNAGVEIPPSVDVLMRYTLRLLTAQQVQRAAALICAMEMLRQSMPEELGLRPFRIGAYLGDKSTPNNRKDAVKLWNALDENPKVDPGGRGFLLTRCPWCGAQMGVTPEGIVGYRKIPTTGGDTRVAAFCPALDCPFKYSGDPSAPGGLPVLEVDEDLYKSPPAFLVGTIDKFAQIAWKPKTRSLFGLATRDGQIVRRTDPPGLLIQDELHLIAGPLGSLDALYEVSIEALCEYDGGQKPKIVAATATTKDFERQVLRLYGRSSVRLVPPPALDVDDSFFARADDAKPGKVFVGVSAPGFGSNVQTQLRVLAALLHAGGTLDVAGVDADPWWTNLVFFSSRRSLGLQLSACQTGLESAAFAMSTLSGLRVGRLTDAGTRHARRAIGHVKELTATSRDNVTQLLSQLAVPKGKNNCIDLCFATSMIEVGVDVSRLGLMTVMGQPKSYSQYIQVTGRVGRSDDGPGVVVVVLSPHSVRDRSHYETFTASHHRLYAGVEPVSITPFTPQALERGLGGALTGLLRTLRDTEDPRPALAEDSIRRALSSWEERAKAIGGGRSQVTLRDETDRLVRIANAAMSSGLQFDWDDFRKNPRHPFLQSLGDQAEYGTTPRWRIPLSMRSVDSEAGVTIPKGVGEKAFSPTSSGDTWEDF